MRRRLAQLERWFQAEVAPPRGRRAARRLGARRVLLPSPTLTPRERVEIYARMYELRMHDALAEDFAAVAKLLGEPGFSRLVQAYLARHPSRHYSLNVLGRNLPRFVESAVRLPRRALVRDVARLEAAMIEVFHAAAVAPLDAGRLAEIDAAAWPRARLVPLPAFALLALDHDANAIVTAVRQGRRLPPLRRRRSLLVVWRRNDVVWRMELDEPMFAALEALARGRTLARALAAAAARWRGDDAALGPAVFSWFRRWTAEGFFAAVKLPTVRGTLDV